MAIGNIKNDIINSYNEAVRGKLAVDSTALDTAIQLCLNDLSKSLDALKATDDSQTLEAGNVSLAYPTDFRNALSIVLIDNSGVKHAPLTMLPGGHREYRQLKDHDSANGESVWYSEFDSKFWLWRPADGDYTTEIEYYRYHPKGQTDNILFDNYFEDCVKFGTIFYKVLLRGNPKYISIWKPMYEDEKENCRLLLPTEPQITGE